MVAAEFFKRVTLTTNRVVSFAVVSVILSQSMYVGLSLAQANGNTPSRVEAPVITSITRSIDNDEAMHMMGTSAPGTKVDINVISDGTGSVFRDVVSVKNDGSWEITISDATFPVGDYVLQAIARNGSGAESVPSEAR